MQYCVVSVRFFSEINFEGLQVFVEKYSTILIMGRFITEMYIKMRYELLMLNIFVEMIIPQNFILQDSTQR